jgi:hypothetical protein
MNMTKMEQEVYVRIDVNRFMEGFVSWQRCGLYLILVVLVALDIVNCDGVYWYDFDMCNVPHFMSFEEAVTHPFTDEHQPFLQNRRRNINSNVVGDAMRSSESEINKLT